MSVIYLLTIKLLIRGISRFGLIVMLVPREFFENSVFFKFSFSKFFEKIFAKNFHIQKMFVYLLLKDKQQIYKQYQYEHNDFF